MAEQLLTTAEVAVLLNKQVSTINRMAASGRLKVAQKLPGYRGPNLFRRADVLPLAKKARAELEAALAEMDRMAS